MTLIAQQQRFFTTSSQSSSAPLRAGDRISPESFAKIRRRLILDCCKWDPQVGDQSTLADFPLLLGASTWRSLSRWSESLAAELMAAEHELIHRPELHCRLALPRRIRRALRDIPRLGATPSIVRVLRFDFHWTTDGWRISEVNSDVPGGYTEASAFTRMIGEASDLHARPAGDPAKTLIDRVTANTAPGGSVALLSAPGFMEDQQVVAYLAGLLEGSRLAVRLAEPSQIQWIDGAARLATGNPANLAAVFRFYQAEWLAHLPRRIDIRNYFAGGSTPVVNAGSSILTESKRLPVVFDDLRTPLSTWRKLLPETRDPRDASWRRDDGWLLKSAFCNTGDTVSARDLISAKHWRAAWRSAHLFPGHWIAQRRFTPLPVETPIGSMFPCIGVYTIDGISAGIYARMSVRPIVDYRAVDVACLVEEESAENAA